jgi:hypothetical protein
VRDSAAGAYLSAHGFGGADGDYANDVAVGAGGAAVVTGRFRGQATFPGGTLSGVAMSSPFLFSLAP